VTYILKTHAGNEVESREIGGSSLIIGRGAGAQLRLDDGTINLEHAHIDHINDTYLLSDNNSTAGTYVNGVKVQKQLLADGDRITIGPYHLVASIDPLNATLALDISAALPQTAPELRDFDYAKAYALYRPYWNKTVLALVLVLISAALLLAPLKAGMQDIFQPAPVTSGHLIFAGQCGHCHQPWRGVSESRCQECHGATFAVHQEQQAFVPSCLICHAEHQEGKSLSAVTDSRCWQCHADLQTKSGGPPRFEPRVTDFATDHPEFTVTVRTESATTRARLSDRKARQSDPASIKLNHLVHLQANLKGPEGLLQLGCKDCHQSAADGTTMLPITYAKQCRHCHLLEFDERGLPGRTVPHAAPDIVDAYLLKVYSNQAGNLPAVRAKLFNNSCATCHELEPKIQALPEIRPAAVPDRWFMHARFSHRSHRVLECAACHTRAARSRQTSDVLIPGIEICRECHYKTESRWPRQNAAAPTQCITCHAYHEQGVNADWDGPLKIRSLREPEPGKEPAGSTRALSVERYLRALQEVFRTNQPSH
jgi:hypothetical protein